MDRYLEILKKTLDHEGGYVNDPNDSGGETIFGITRKNHSNLYLWGFVDNFKSNNDIKSKSNINKLNELAMKDTKCIEDIKNVYMQYYNGIKGSLINDNRVVACIFDMSVNAGIKQASKLAQRVVGVNDDGIIGNLSVNAINDYDGFKFVREYSLRRIRYYIDITKKNPTNINFMYSWIHRTISYI